MISKLKGLSDENISPETSEQIVAQTNQNHGPPSPQKEQLEHQQEEKIAADFPIVGIGASAGGLRAIEDFFDNMPPENGAAFVVIQHLSPDFKSLMNELLERRTKMNVLLATEGMSLEANTIFLIPAGQNMMLQGSSLHLSPQNREEGNQPHFPIDLFFQSLASEGSERIISIVLSGTGSDGSRGVQKVSEAGGIVLVQEPNTAEFDGMPRSSIATGVADLVLPAHALANVTYQFITSANQRREFKAHQNQQLNPSVLQKIVNIIETYENIDFTQYKPSTLTRRIKRRCLIAGYNTLEEYIRALQNSEAERSTLRNDLLITVTRFFRDREAWAFLESTILPELIERAKETKTLRVWVSACATGEEAYSMAMLIQEIIERTHSPVRAKVFATDIDALALAKASAGVYPKEVISSLSAERRDRFFTIKEETVEVSKALREVIIFANHNLTKDASFTQMDLVSCRNVLIYMQPQLQQQVLRNFHFSLKVDSILFLGESENLGPLTPEFKIRQKKWKIYQKLRDIRLPFTSSDFTTTSSQLVQPNLFSRPTKAPRFDPLLETAFESLLRHRKATCLLVDRDEQLIHLCCDSLNLIRIATGRASQDILKMVPESLRLPLSSAIHRARQQPGPVVYKSCQVPEEGVIANAVTIEVSQQKNLETGSFLMVTIEPKQETLGISSPDFEDDEADTDKVEATGTQKKDRYVFQLQQQLQDTQENLQATIEELETTNEEQQSTNEELTASNEELQSTNEELHSVNEELHTVNAEYQSKIQQLTRLNNDLDNLLNNTEIGVIYLDRDLKIRKFTPAASPAFNLVNNDIGRPVLHLSHSLEDLDLAAAMALAQQQKHTVEREVRIKQQGLHLLLRIYPYLNEDQAYDGLIITLVNIDEIKKSQEDLAVAQADLSSTNERLEREVRDRTKELANSQQLLQSITQATPSGIYIYDLVEQKNVYANAFMEKLLGYKPEQIKAMGDQVVAELFHPDDLETIAAHHQQIASSDVDNDHIFEVEYRIRNVQAQWRHFYSQDVIFQRSPTGEPTQILGIALDISDNKEILLQLKDSEVRYRNLYQNNPVMMHSLDDKNKIISVNNAWLTCAGYAENEVVGKPISDFIRPDVNPSLTSTNASTNQEEDCSYTLIAENQQVIDVQLFSVTEQDEAQLLDQNLVGMIDITQSNRVKVEFERYREHLEELVTQRADEIRQRNQQLRAEVTEREQAQSELADYAQELERSNSSLEEFAYVVSHDLQEPLRAMTVFSQLLDQRYKKQLDKTASNYLKNIVEGGVRMQALIDGILNFSRISHQPPTLEPVDLNPLLSTILSNLSSTLEDIGATVTVQDLPVVLGDHNQMTQLFQNLLGNALKFRSSDPPVITISASPDEQQPDSYVLGVQDNGIGIDQAQQERIFSLFQRLHTRQEIEGYGIGLAICKKIIERHHGKMWVASTPGQGSTFYFTISRAF